MSELDETLSRFRDAWNRHDVDELAALWTDDGELNHPWGFRAIGRPAIRRLLADEHAGSMAASSLRIVSTTPVSHDRNVVGEVEGVLDDVAAPNGKRYSLPHKLTVMLVSNGTGWLIKTMTALPA
jgi:ketosteroid isomerase-like protein